MKKITIISLCIAILSLITTNSYSQFLMPKTKTTSIGSTGCYAQKIDLNSYYTCNDGGHYYIRQIGQEVYWFGEYENGAWANVFKGTIKGSKIIGYFLDVPKGRANGLGKLVLSVSEGGRNITKVSGDGFGGSKWSRKKSLPSRLPGKRYPGYCQKGNINDLDGAWSCNDNGTYYIREINGKIAWFGEALDRNGKAIFANVGMGTRSGNNVTLDWADVSKCNIKGKGQLKLRVCGADRLTKVNNGNGFGGSEWSR